MSINPRLWARFVLYVNLPLAVIGALAIEQRSRRMTPR
jgi:hypothetical protein